MSKQHPEDFHEHPDSSDEGRPESRSDWLRDQLSAQTAGSGDRDEQPTSRATRRLAEHRISLPGPRSTVYSEEHGGSVQVDPWFAPDGMLRGGILILPDGAEIRAGPDVIEQMLGPDELHEARGRLGLVRGDTSDDDMASSEMETALQPVPLHAQIDSQGVPLMPDSAPTYFGRQPRPTEPPSGNWGYDEAFDDEHGLVSGTLLRNARKAGKRAWPLVLLGAGWLWDRAQPLAQRMAAQWPNLHTGSTTRRTRLRRRAWMGALAAALVCLALSFCGILSLIQRGSQFGVSNLPANPVDAAATIADAATATETSVQATATASAIITGGGIPPTPRPTLVPPTASPTPDPHAPNASVSFTRTSMTAQAPSTLVTYDGAPDDAPGGSTRGQKLSDGPTAQGGTYGNSYQQTGGGSATIFVVYYFCNGGVNGCFLANAPGVVIHDSSGNGYNCTIDSPANLFSQDAQNPDQATCHLGVVGPINSTQVRYWDKAPCSGVCNAVWGGVAGQSVGTSATYAYFVPGSCVGQGQSAAQTAAVSAAAAQLGSGLGADAIAAQTSAGGAWCAWPGNCSAHVGDGQQMGSSTYAVCASATGWKLTYSPSGAQNEQKARIAPNAGYAIDTATISVCSSVSVQSTDIPNQRATLYCPASATVRYVWTPDMLTTLRGQLAGKTPSQANSMLAATAGIAANSIHVTIPSGFSSLPSDPNAITITVS